MSVIRAYAITIWSLLRYQTWFLIVLYGLIAVISTLTYSYDKLQSESYFRLIVGIFTIGLWYAFGTGLNDYADYEVDKINLKNAKDRPLISGYVNKKGLLYTAFFLAIFCLILSWYISLSALIISIAFLFLNFAYSIKPFSLSGRGGIAQILLPSGYIVYPSLILTSATRTNIELPQLLLIIALYLQFSSRILLKDYRDIKGDKKNNKRTFLINHGNDKVVNFSTFGLVLSSIIFMSLTSSFIITTLILVFLSTLGLGILRSLKLTNDWSIQKPIIVSYGRICSGINVVLLIYYIFKTGSIGTSSLMINSLIATILFVWSARDISKNIN